MAQQAVRDYGKLALDIIRLVGGGDNISSAARCATRLRLVLKDTPAGAEEQIKGLPGVIAVVQKQGQFQVVIGNHVGDVFEAVSRELKLDSKGADAAPASKESLLNRILQMMSGVFAPICYILAAGGLLQGALIILTMLAPAITDSGVYQILNMISWTPFTFLPILIAISSSRHFNCSIFVAVACCLALVNPAWTELAGRIAAGENLNFLFVPLTEITYTSSVLPPLAMVALLAILERWLNKHLPDMIRPLFTPLICLVVMVPLTIVVIGPVIQGVSGAVAAGYNFLHDAVPVLAGAVVGGLWEVIVIFGIQWGMVPIVVANFEQNGFDTIQIFIEIAVMAQMAAAFGGFLKTRNKELKANALSAGITAIFGITEPTIYGITLPRKRPFVIACLWAAVGSAAAALLGAVQYVYAGLPGMISIVNSISTEHTMSFPACAIGSAVAIIGTVVTIMVLGYETAPKQDKAEQTLPAQKSSAAPSGPLEIPSPIPGKVVSLENVPDETFSTGVLGNGFAVEPSEGKVYAPFDGECENLADTLHALRLLSETGVSLLIHVGLETVALEGKPFKPHVKTGDKIKKGQLLLEFDIDAIKAADCEAIVPVLVTNEDEVGEAKVEADKIVIGG